MNIARYGANSKNAVRRCRIFASYFRHTRCMPDSIYRLCKPDFGTQKKYRIFVLSFVAAYNMPATDST